VLSTATYSDLTLGNGAISVPGQGDVFVQITESGSALAGAVVSVSPAPAYATYYDGNSATEWNQNDTGSHGVAWVPGITAGSATITIRPPSTGSGSATSTTLNAAIGDQTLTFVAVAIP
jgi:hypothetical protein